MLHGMAFSEDYIILQTLICIYCAGQTDERLVVRRLVLVGLCRDLCLLVTSAAVLFAQIFYFILKVLCQTDIPSPELRACIAVVDSERTLDLGLGFGNCSSVACFTLRTCKEQCQQIECVLCVQSLFIGVNKLRSNWK